MARNNLSVNLRDMPQTFAGRRISLMEIEYGNLLPCSTF